MPFFTSLTLASGAAIAGIAIAHKRNVPRLVNALNGGTSTEATLLPPATQQMIEHTQELLQELFSDTRQTYEQALNISHDNAAALSVEQQQRRNLIVSTTGVGLSLGGALLTPLLYLPAALCVVYASGAFFKDAYRRIVIERQVDYHLIWALIIPVALAGGFILEANLGAALGLINWYLVAKTENRSKRTIADLFGGQVSTVWLLVDGVEIETPLSQVQRGDTVVVQAGQMIPVDGTIITGTATIDQHMLTGESQPIEMEVGDSVLASTIVLSGQLCIRVDQAGDATVAAQITQMLSQTTDFKRLLESRTDRWLNRMMLPLLGLSILSLPVAGMSGAVAVLWYYPGARMIVFGPMSMLSYLQVAAQRRILIKDGRALEVLEEINTVVFDKTGTLTLEQPTVSRIICCNGMAESTILRYAAAAETKQSHPIAHAIRQAANDNGLQLPALDDAQYKVGYGLKVQIEGHTIRVGSARFITNEGLDVSAAITAQQIESHQMGNSLVLVGIDDEVAGAIELMPTIRPEAQNVIQTLHERGIETVIISGDNEAPTRRLAVDLGIDHYFAEVLPEDKANLVAQLQTQGRKVCFVGDGINDAIALKTANVAVSLRGATTVATDMAEIVFMDGTLEQLPSLFELADEFAANMRTNLIASTLPGVVGIAGTLLFGWGMGLAVLLSQGSTPVGVYNALKPLLEERSQRNKLLGHSSGAN